MELPPPNLINNNNNNNNNNNKLHIDFLWELTQAIIAISITGTVIYLSMNKIESVALDNALIIIVALYFKLGHRD